MYTKDQIIALRKEGYGYNTLVKKTGIPYSTIRFWTKGIYVDARTAYLKSIEIRLKPISELNPLSKDTIRKRLILKRGWQCQSCRLFEWSGKPITLEIEHKDGNHKNNNEENLELLCPNCHSYTATWRRKKLSC